MPSISFMTANFVAREVGWTMPDWEAGDRSVNAAFSPIETYRERFGALLDEARALGFDVIDLWDAHLSAAWATDAHLATAADVLAERSMRVASLAGWFGSDRAQFERHCLIAAAVGAPLLGGRTKLLDTDRDWMRAALERHGLRFGLENHPERTPGEVLERIGPEADGLIGATVDTGWFGTQGYDAAQAIEELGERIVHVHLKDVAHAGEPHETCAYGDGVVPMNECVEALRRLGYGGAISIEHVPDDHDPRDEIRAAREQLESWLPA
ncbi:MAG: sugar phosphate isomerase/epimerase [Chloroflexota bacterium]|nr:sugar phosphate isomerase/epimerase [Chloroflexota bacterium]